MKGVREDGGMKENRLIAVTMSFSSVTEISLISQIF